MTWTPTSTEAERDGIVGGDGAGESWSVRFAHPDHPMNTLTIYVYPFDHHERGREDLTEDVRYDVEAMTSFDTWDRPWFEDDAEIIDSDIAYDYPIDGPIRSWEHAEAIAKSIADDWSRNGHRYITWTPPMS